MKTDHIRNFSIIAHIDHGKSTLADRLLEITGTVSSRDMTEQIMDQMELERERGITIKGKAVKMSYNKQGSRFQLNLIDTPGHVDFGYEVSRALAACEGAILVVDATQGIQAQTLANVYLAMEHDMTIIPVVNKIDLQVAQPARVSLELQQAFGFTDEEIIFVSAKDGSGIEDLLAAIIERIPPPKTEYNELRALVFDSNYDPYKGVVAYVRLFDGHIEKGSQMLMMATGSKADILEVGNFLPRPTQTSVLAAGEVGYIATGLKNVRECRVGDTLTLTNNPSTKPLPGYQPLKPMVFAGLYPSDGDEYLVLRTALEKLQLNDAALVYEPETSAALGFGFRCGFLGLLHMEIVQERLEREYGLNLLITAPSVRYSVTKTDGEEIEVDSPAKLPPTHLITEMKEPILSLNIVVPAKFIGAVMDIVTAKRGEFVRMEYLQNNTLDESVPDSSESRVLLEYRAPLSEILMDFYDQLKSRTHGYASMDYSIFGYKAAPLVKLDILVNNQPVDALSLIVHKEKSLQQGKTLVERLKNLIPRQMFEVPVQAAIGNRVISRETIRALRKNVLAKCYGGDITRKRKLLEKQAEGKKRMKRVGNVEIPQEAFLAILQLDR
ncbi:MAG: elongation factor 4 [SAR202 cluster bacterium]|nr:elongation factor 4 [SAR202 cluster bacterium]|tara:strand:+ start:2297 stop:4126 length:1830 start_codon:yes stop_codon:yes gene_type:complete